MNLFFAYFLVGHLIGDFFLQNNYIAKYKNTNRLVLIVHVCLVFISTAILFYPFLNHRSVFIALLINAVVHLFADYLKVEAEKEANAKKESQPLLYFWTDQIGHIVFFTLLVRMMPSGLSPGLLQNVWWLEYYLKADLLFYVAGFLFFSYMADIIMLIQRIDSGDFSPYNRDYYNMMRRTFIFAVLFMIFWYFINFIR